MRIDKERYEQDKRSISFEYKYKRKRLEFIQDIAFTLLKPQFPANLNQNSGLGQYRKEDLEYHLTEGDLDWANELCVYLQEVITTGNLDPDSALEAAIESVDQDISIADTLDTEYVQKAANLFQYLMEEASFEHLISTYENITKGTDDNTVDDFKVMADFPSCFITFVNKINLDCGIAYSKNAEDSIVILYQDLNTPQKLISFLTDPFEIEQTKALSLVWNWYLTEEDTKKHPIVCHMNRQKLVLKHVPYEHVPLARQTPHRPVSDETVIDEDERKQSNVFEKCKEFVQKATENPILMYDDCIENVGWLRRLFKNHTTAKKMVLKPVIQNAIPDRKLGQLTTEIDNELRQYNLSLLLRDTNLSYTLQWFVLSTKLYALTLHMRQNISPARFRLSVLDKKTSKANVWKLMRTLAPNSFAAVNIHTEPKFDKKLPTWVSVLESCGYKLRL